MDKKNSKKTEQTRPEKRDRGDNLKKEKTVKKFTETGEVKVPYPGGDSERKVKKLPHSGGDSERKVGKLTHSGGDSERKVAKVTHPGSDSERKVAKGSHSGGDSERKVAKATHSGGDSERKAAKVTHPGGGSERKMGKLPQSGGDSERKLSKVPHLGGESERKLAKVTPSGGDSERKVAKLDKPKAIVFKKPDDVKLKTLEYLSKENVKLNNTDHFSTEIAPKKPDKSDIEVLERSDKDVRAKIREKYTVKVISPAVPSIVKKEETPKVNVKLPAVEVKIDRPQKIFAVNKEKNDSSIESKPSDSSKPEKDSVHRKPIIKTVTAKNDHTKIFKAVTFVDQKKVKPTALQIKIPNDDKNERPMRTVETNTAIKKIKNTISRVSVKEKSARKKSEKRKRQKQRLATSPDLSVRMRSPPTEVAKWAPSSINRHTKPYYEAWVNTTLAAISKNSRKDKLFMEKQNILQSFQRALAERPETPELVYENCTDERYTGRIKVKQR